MKSLNNQQQGGGGGGGWWRRQMMMRRRRARERARGVAWPSTSASTGPDEDADADDRDGGGDDPPPAAAVAAAVLLVAQASRTQNWRVVHFVVHRMPLQQHFTIRFSRPVSDLWALPNVQRWGKSPPSPVAGRLHPLYLQPPPPPHLASNPALSVYSPAARPLLRRPSSSPALPVYAPVHHYLHSSAPTFHQIINGSNRTATPPLLPSGAFSSPPPTPPPNMPLPPTPSSFRRPGPRPPSSSGTPCMPPELSAPAAQRKVAAITTADDGVAVAIPVPVAVAVPCVHARDAVADALFQRTTSTTTWTVIVTKRKRVGSDEDNGDVDDGSEDDDDDDEDDDDEEDDEEDDPNARLRNYARRARAFHDAALAAAAASSSSPTRFHPPPPPPLHASPSPSSPSSALAFLPGSSLPSFTPLRHPHSYSDAIAIAAQSRRRTSVASFTGSLPSPGGLSMLVVGRARRNVWLQAAKEARVVVVVAQGAGEVAVEPGAAVIFLCRKEKTSVEERARKEDVSST
ncbi:hypothetical protein DFJ73DRAFT_926878 [Zopfochytrium polystomum]|nr:hypothetical protein DFJ73DRAFT_926878 [Zopfochytrium polystomum]